MIDATDTGLDRLIGEIGLAVESPTIADVTETVKHCLEDFSRGTGSLPDRYLVPGRDSYARRLLHRDPQGRFTLVVMTWGPDQGTSLHDHAGIWCVECVLQGRLEVTQYDLLEQREGRCRFERQASVPAGVGSAGCLIPPYEYHTLANALHDQSTVSLHVYGGEMEHCNLYRPAAADWWERISRSLAYDD